MPDGLAAALATPGLAALLGAATLAGVVYGFAGFGAALIFVPLAAALVPAEWAVLLMAAFALASSVTVLPRAWARAEQRAALQMIAAGALALPLGTWALARLPEAPLRWAICGVVAVTLAALMAGWRHRATPGPATRTAVGAASGVLGGATGLTGPVVILFHLSGPSGAEATRANTIVFLTLLGIALIPSLALQGLVTAPALWLAVLLVPVYMIGTRVGQALFDPGREALYRSVAHGVIALAVVAGLPVWR